MRNKRETDGDVDAKGRVSRSHTSFAMETVHMCFAPHGRNNLPLVSRSCHASHITYY